MLLLIFIKNLFLVTTTIDLDGVLRMPRHPFGAYQMELCRRQRSLHRKAIEMCRLLCPICGSYVSFSTLVFSGNLFLIGSVVYPCCIHVCAPQVLTIYIFGFFLITGT
ncbi:NADPH--cytochrome P450 reductase [Iris pallida]|uniref:NADPH--cytochrome P450 reductase n=1 Tax=Iris pallida TaxID=29817 RepID=A0AAX6HW22_IRIPA|nr:NADPH--cytochrome P450 reductase [Iris pallida]